MTSSEIYHWLSRRRNSTWRREEGAYGANCIWEAVFYNYSHFPQAFRIRQSGIIFKRNDKQLFSLDRKDSILFYFTLN